MTKKFDVKVFLGKKRVYRSVVGSPRITRVFVWNGKEYAPPKDGKLYLARRYEPNPDGKLNRVSRYFVSLNEARYWQTGQKPVVILQDPNAYTVSRLIHDWQKSIWSTIRESTRIYYSKAIPFYKFLFHMEVEKITPSTIDSWLVHLKEQSAGYRHP